MDTLNEIELKQRSEARQVRSDADVFHELMKHPGWPRFLTLVETIAQNYHVAIMKPVENILEMPKAEFAKGVLSGLSLATAIPQMKINEARELRSQPDEEE